MLQFPLDRSLITTVHRSFHILSSENPNPWIYLSSLELTPIPGVICHLLSLYFIFLAAVCPGFKKNNGVTTLQTNWDTLIVEKVFSWKRICASELSQAAENMNLGFPFLPYTLQWVGYGEKEKKRHCCSHCGFWEWKHWPVCTLQCNLHGLCLSKMLGLLGLSKRLR